VRNLPALAYSRSREFPKGMEMEAVEPNSEPSGALRRNLLLVTSYLVLMALIAIGYA
jgi:hypothetical protein